MLVALVRCVGRGLRRCVGAVQWWRLRTIPAVQRRLTWDQKVEELRKIGELGADAHYILLTQNKQPTNDECTANYRLLGDGAPSDIGAGSTPEWRDLHQSYFVDSCVTGKPRVPNTRPADPPTSTAPPTPASAAPSAKP